MLARAQTIAPPAKMLTKKASSGPPNGRRIAANAGPTNCAALKVEELSAMAVEISDRGTRFGINARRTGCQNEKVTPRASAMANRSQMVIRPAKVNTVRKIEITTRAA